MVNKTILIYNIYIGQYVVRDKDSHLNQTVHNIHCYWEVTNL